MGYRLTLLYREHRVKIVTVQTGLKAFQSVHFSYSNYIFNHHHHHHYHHHTYTAVEYRRNIPLIGWGGVSLVLNPLCSSYGQQFE